MQPVTSLGYTPSATGARMFASTAFVNVVMGPVGGGKSTMALMYLFQRSVQQEPFNGVRRTKWAILRNTAGQLRATVKPLIDTWFVDMTGGRMGRWRLSEGTFEARFRLPDGTVVHSEYMMVAADTPDDVRRLLSMEVTGAWVEEAREVDGTVFENLQSRTNRYPSRAMGGATWAGVVCSTNPPAQGTFWHQLIDDPPANVKVFVQPPAMLADGALNPERENREHLAPDYYENLVDGKTQEWLDVYLRNKFGAGDWGRPVFRRSFKSDFHVSKAKLEPLMQALNPLIVGMDNGLQAAAVVCQRDMRGRVNVLRECYVPKDATMGVETFLDTLLIPMLTDSFPSFRRENVVFVLDPACFQRSQVDEKTIAQAVQARRFVAVKAKTNDPERRIQAVESLLSLQVDGQAALRLDPGVAHLARALEWGYRFRPQPASGASTPSIEKNHYSHCFVAGTMVETPDGPRPIEALGSGDEVLTPKGSQPVEAVMTRAARELVELQFDDGTTLVCTPDHPFPTSRGRLEANELECNDVLFSIKGGPCFTSQTSYPTARGDAVPGTLYAAPTSQPTTPVSTAGGAIEPSRSRSSGGSALQPASRRPAGLRGSMTTNESASCAERSSHATSTQRPRRAVRVVGKRRFPAQSAAVYDLTVRGEHQFYANGIQTYNCADALQYACLHYDLTQTDTTQRTQARKVVSKPYIYA